MASYVVLCIKLDSILPGHPTIPEQIVSNRDPYFAALDAADASLRDHQTIDVTKMEDLLSGMLAEQLKSAYELASGQIADEA